MFYRRKVILALLQEFGGYLPGIDFQKYLFLFTQLQEKKVYHFVPYKFGCFSFQSYADKRIMIQTGLLAEEEGWKLQLTDNNYISELTLEDQGYLQYLKKDLSHLRGNELLHHVYTNFPYYAIHSEIAEKILNAKELQAVDNQRNKEKQPTLFTIGYEGRSLEQYLNLLIGNNVKILCDVRKNPFSMKYGFSKNQLKTTSENLGIEYIHIPALGIDSEKRKDLQRPEDYKKLFEYYEKDILPKQKEALNTLIALLKIKKRVAITCFEVTHQFCHRGCITNYLNLSPDWSFPILHL